MAGFPWGTVNVMLVSNNVVDAVAACWCAPPLPIGMSDVEPKIVELMTEINYTRSVTRSWIRVLLSEEAQLEVVAEQIPIYVTLPSIPLPWDTARIIKGFLLDDTKPVVVDSPDASTVLHVARYSFQQLSHLRYVLVGPLCLQTALEERVCQEKLCTIWCELDPRS